MFEIADCVVEITVDTKSYNFAVNTIDSLLYVFILTINYESAIMWCEKCKTTERLDDMVEISEIIKVVCLDICYY